MQLDFMRLCLACFLKLLDVVAWFLENLTCYRSLSSAVSLGVECSLCIPHDGMKAPSHVMYFAGNSGKSQTLNLEPLDIKEPYKPYCQLPTPPPPCAA